MGRPARLILPLSALAILAVSVESAWESATGGPKLLIIVPIAALFGLGLAVLGYMNFEMFAFATIAIRASLDVTRPSLGNSGAAGTGTASASGLDPAGALAVLFMVAALFWWMSRRTAGRKAPPPSIHRIALIIFAVVGFFSIVDSGAPTVSLLEAVRVSAVATMLAVMEVLLVDRTAIRRLLTAIYLSATIPIGVALFFIVLHHPQFSSGGFGRYQGTFSQPNPFAIYLTMLIVMGAAIFPTLAARTRLMVIPLLAGCLVCLYYTYTRSAWVAVVIGLGTVALVGKRRVLTGALVLGLVVAVLAFPTISHRFADLGSAQVNAAGNTSNSLAWRFAYWGEILPLVERNPVTGIGLKMSSFETVQAKEPHNDLLKALVETGVLGALAYLGLLLSMVLVARQGLKRASPGFDRNIAVGFTGCVLAFLAISVVSNVITEVIVLWYYVAFAAAAYAVTQFRAPAFDPVRSQRVGGLLTQAS